VFACIAAAAAAAAVDGDFKELVYIVYSGETPTTVDRVKGRELSPAFARILNPRRVGDGIRFRNPAKHGLPADRTKPI